MKNVLTRLAGLILLLVGGGVSLWLIYSLFTPADAYAVRASGSSVGKGIVFSGVVGLVGGVMLFGKRSKPPRDTDRP